MLQQLWRGLTELPETSSGGPSQLVSTMPYDRAFSEPAPLVADRLLRLEGTLGTGDSTYQFAGEWKSDGDATKRMLGCLILLALPAIALEETVDTLRENWQFYSTQSDIVPSLVATERVSGARALPASDRPVLMIEER
jgi:hypothetical protein